MNPSTWEGPTASSLVIRALRRFPDRIAFSSDAGELSYAATLDLIARFQAVIHSDARAPLRVSVLSTNRADAWCVEQAVQALGGSVNWLHPLGAFSDHLDQLADAGTTLFVVDASAFGKRGAALAAKAPSLHAVWTLGPAEYGRDLLQAARDVGAVTARDLSSPNDIATLQYTGGTTGKSKAAVRRQRAHATMWRAILTDFEVPAVPRFLAAAPISHVGGSKIAPVLLRGGTVHMMQRYEPGRFLADVQKHRISMSLLVPTMIYGLLDHPDLARTDTSSLELLLYGASPMSPSRLEEGLARLGPVFSQLYGQSECYPICVLRKADHDVARQELFASCGAPALGADVQLLDDSNQPVAAGEAGEICVRAPYAMEGYWQRDDLTASTLVDGWLHTSDIARADDRGYLYIVDRKKDMIVSGGFNVYPREVEDVLARDPAVAMAAVIGIPDAKWGEAVLAVVVPRPGATIDAESLVQLVKQSKGAQHAPKRVEVVDSLPLTSLGKLDKKALRAPYWSGASRQVA